MYWWWKKATCRKLKVIAKRLKMNHTNISWKLSFLKKTCPQKCCDFQWTCGFSFTHPVFVSRARKKAKVHWLFSCFFFAWMPEKKSPIKEVYFETKFDFLFHDLLFSYEYFSIDFEAKAKKKALKEKTMAEMWFHCLIEEASRRCSFDPFF